MSIARYTLAACIFATSVLYAQDKDAKPETPAQPVVSQTQKSNEKNNEAFRITLTFKSTDSAKVTTQRSYTFVATTNEFPPQIRDESRIPVPTNPGVSSNYQYQTLETNVDSQGMFHRVGDSVFLGLRVSTDSLAETGTPDKPMPPIFHHHVYALSPTVPIGKQMTVYSATDTVNNATVEMQVLVQPANTK